jgi:hypothetical protein
MRLFKIAVAVLMAACWVACAGRGDSELGQRIASEVERGEGTQLDLAELTSFSWSRLYVFAPHTTEETMAEALGFVWSGASAVGLEERDDVSLLVFVEDGAVAGHLAHRREQGDFADAARPGVYARAEAVFRVQQEGEWQRLVLVLPGDTAEPDPTPR